MENQAFGNAEALQRALTQAQAGQIQGRAQDARAGLGGAIADATTLAQQRGMNFQGFNPAEQARLYGGAEGAVAGMEADANLAGTQLGGVLVGMQGARRQAGLGFRDSQTDRRQARQIDERERTAAEARARQSADTSIQAAQIRAQRQAAERAERERQQIAESERETFDEMLKKRQGPDGKVSPTAYDDLRALWIEQGGTNESFDQNFLLQYANQDHLDDYTPEGFRALQQRKMDQERRDFISQPPQTTSTFNQLLAGRLTDRDRRSFDNPFGIRFFE